MSRYILCLLFLLNFSFILKGTGTDEFSDSILVIGSGVRIIPAYSYQDRKDITEVRFEGSSSLVSIGAYAFLGCENLRKVTLPSSLRSLGEGVFRECLALKEIDLPDGMEKLPPFLFYWCENLERIGMPSRLKVISRSCFGFCRRLEKIDIPGTVKNIGSNAFSCCESLKEVKLPISIVELESYAFSDCRSLRKIAFPSNSSLLGELILSGCYKLEEIDEYSPSPPAFDCNSYVFEPDETEMYRNVILYVAPGKTESYGKSPGWRMFEKIEER